MAGRARAAAVVRGTLVTLSAVRRRGVREGPVALGSRMAGATFPGAVLGRSGMTRFAGRLVGVGERPAHAALGVARFAGGVVADDGVIVGPAVALGAAASGRVTEDPLRSRLVALGAGVTDRIVLRRVARFAPRRLHVVARGAFGSDVLLDVVLALAQRCNDMLAAHRRVLGIVDTGLDQCGLGDGVSHGLVAIHAGVSLGMLVVLEAGGVGLHVLVAGGAPLVGDQGCFLKREGRIAGHVDPYLTKRHELVAQPRGDSGVHVAGDAGDIRVGTGAPCRVVRLHLVACVAEGRAVCGLGDTKEPQEKEGGEGTDPQSCCNGAFHDQRAYASHVLPVPICLMRARGRPETTIGHARERQLRAR